MRKSLGALACAIAVSAALTAAQAQTSTTVTTPSSPVATPTGCPAPTTGNAIVDQLNAMLCKYDVKANNANIFQFDYGIPTSPALTLIGASTDKSPPSTSLKPYVFELPTAWGGSKDSQAFSADFSVMWGMEVLGASPRETYQDYIDGGYLHQLAYRTRLEGALFPGDDGGGDPTKAKDSRLAFGFSMSLLSSSDPSTVTEADGSRTVWAGCVEDFLYKSDLNKQYQTQYNADPAEQAWRQFTAMANNEDVAWNAQYSTTPRFTQAQLDGMAATGYQSLAPCMNAGGVCAKYDDGSLQKALAESGPGKYQDVHTAVEAIRTKVQAALDTVSASIEQKLGIATQLNGCMDKANAAARQSADLDIGGGVVWSGKPGSAENFKDPSGALWIAGHIPIGLFNSDPTSIKDTDAPSLMLGGSLRGAWSEMVSTGDTTTPNIKANTLNAWVGLERYTADSRFAVEGGYNDIHAIGSGLGNFSKSGFRWQVSASLKAGNFVDGILNGQFLSGDASSSSSSLTNGVWVNFTYGSASGTTTTLDDKTFMISLSYSPGDPYNVFGESQPASSSAAGAAPQH